MCLDGERVRSQGEQHKREHKRIQLPFDQTKTFGTYALEWTPRNLLWYLNGNEVWRTDNPPHDPFFIYLGLYEALASHSRAWTGKLDTTQPYPRDFAVDYIRVYKRTAQTLHGAADGGESVDES